MSLLPLTTSSLGFRTTAGKTLLHNIDLHIESNGITAIMGPNGAGKSLLMRILHGLIQPTFGTVLWNNRALDVATRKRQALVFQKPVLLRRSVAANIDFVLRGSDGVNRLRREDILAQAELSEKSGQAARLLSGGEQQRLALARALATNPEALLLDEPSASLDPGNTAKIESLLQQTRERGIKILLVTHDIGQAQRLAEDIVFMHNGGATEYTAADTFFDHPSSRQARAYLEGKLIL